MSQINKTTNNNNMKGTPKMNQSIRITEDLKWANLKDRYLIGTLRVNGKLEKTDQLSEAIKAGELDELFKTCADALHGGDLYEAYSAFNRNLSSTKTNMRNKDVGTDAYRLDVLRKYVSEQMKNLKGAARGNVKPYWLWTVEEIDAIPLTDKATINSVYNNMASRLSVYGRDGVDADYDARFKAISDRRSAANALAKQNELSIDEALLSKLTAGSAARLTKEEAKQVAELLLKMKR